MRSNPGFLGWLGIGAVVALADGYAIARHQPTMSTVFTQHKGWAVFIMGGVVAHLLLNEVVDAVSWRLSPTCVSLWRMTTILFVPDTQCRPGEPDDHLRWLGHYIMDKRPDVVVHAGDHWDFPSLSSYDRGTLSMEGRRLDEDIKAGNDGLALITAPLRKHQARKLRTSTYDPRLVLLRGNHEDRLRRAIEENGHLDGALSFDHLKSPGWEVHDYLEPVEIEGVYFSHFFANPMSGRPYGGQAITRLKQLGHSFVQGHQQVLEFATRYVAGRKQTAVVAGAFYLGDEPYKGPQGNHHWRGVVMLHEVDRGSFDLMEVSIAYLCRRYEGLRVDKFLQWKYPDQTGVLWRWNEKEESA